MNYSGQNSLRQYSVNLINPDNFTNINPNSSKNIFTNSSINIPSNNFVNPNVSTKPNTFLYTTPNNSNITPNYNVSNNSNITNSNIINPNIPNVVNSNVANNSSTSTSNQLNNLSKNSSTVNNSKSSEDIEARNCILRGYWVYLHIRAKWGNLSRENQLKFSEELRYTANTFPCEECKEHFIKYLDRNPPEQAINMNEYMWEFHNIVNKRLGKEIMSFETYTNIYLSGDYKCNACHLKNDNVESNSENNLSKGTSNSGNNYNNRPIQKIPGFYIN